MVSPPELAVRWLLEYSCTALPVAIFVSTNAAILNLGGAIFERKHRHETFLIELKCKASFPVPVSLLADCLS